MAFSLLYVMINIKTGDSKEVMDRTERDFRELVKPVSYVHSSAANKVK
jgi:hypothetical protein